MSPAVDPRVGTELAGYRIERVVGRGGMGVVYLAVQKRLDRRVALKVLPPEYADDPGFRERFERESQMAAAIDHPNILPIYEAGEADGLLFIAMRFVEGMDLRARLEQRGTVELGALLPILSQVAAALDAAHRKGLVHRDVKPGNILISSGVDSEGADHVYLADFGVAKRAASGAALTRTGFFVGTLDYAAPEQIEGKKLDGRVDVYALGCVLYHCLTGARPFDKDSEVAVMYAHLSETPPRLTAARSDLPAGLDAVIAKAMAKSPNERYQTARELMAAARAVSPTVAATPPAAPAATPVTVDEALHTEIRATEGAELIETAVSGAGQTALAPSADPVREPERAPRRRGRLLRRRAPSAEPVGEPELAQVFETVLVPAAEPDPGAATAESAEELAGTRPETALAQRVEPIPDKAPGAPPEPASPAEPSADPVGTVPAAGDATAVAEPEAPTGLETEPREVQPRPPSAPGPRPARRKLGRRAVVLLAAAGMIATGGVVGAVLATGGDPASAPATSGTEPAPTEPAQSAGEPPVQSEEQPSPQTEPQPSVEETAPPPEELELTIDEQSLVQQARTSAKPCEPLRPPGPETAAAAITCGLDGPVRVRYVLFSSGADRGRYYASLRPEGIPEGDGVCGDRARAENVYVNEDGASVGRLLCYPAGGRPRIAWTTDSTNVVALAQTTGSWSLAALIRWWAVPGFVQPEPEIEPLPPETEPPVETEPPEDPLCSDPGVDPVIKERAGCPGY
jgi:serine/threonine-protein kinase